jgi:hypothetical protein
MRGISTGYSRGRGPSHPQTTIDKAIALRELGDTLEVVAEQLGVSTTTVARWTADVETPDTSGRWTLADAVRRIDPDPVVVMAELGAVILSTGGRVTGMTVAEARWVTLLAKVDPDTAASAPGTTWQRARAYIRAIAAEAADEPKRKRPRRSPSYVGDVQTRDQDLAVAAAEARWPGLTDRIAALGRVSRKTAAALAARKNPFLDGTSYDDGGARAAKEARKGSRRRRHDEPPAG